jgi:hypothetical protein
MTYETKEQNKSNNYGVAEYAVMCCGRLVCIRGKKFKQCKVCGKILKDETGGISNNAD